jgi:selenocysteine-specific elongation factor
LSELRAAFPAQRPELIEALITDLDANEFVRTRSTIARRSHRAVLPPELRTTAHGILQQLGAKPFDPPSRKQIAPDSRTQQALRFLIERGEVIEIGPDGILSSESFGQMKDRVVAFISKNGAATVSQLRQELQTSRRIIVPFLERLDRDGVTHRSGDQRKLADEIVSRALK